jgi:hypothetical protein
MILRRPLTKPCSRSWPRPEGIASRYRSIPSIVMRHAGARPARVRGISFCKSTTYWCHGNLEHSTMIQSDFDKAPRASRPESDAETTPRASHLRRTVGPRAGSVERATSTRVRRSPATCAPRIVGTPHREAHRDSGEHEGERDKELNHTPRHPRFHGVGASRNLNISSFISSR